MSVLSHHSTAYMSEEQHKVYDSLAAKFGARLIDQMCEDGEIDIQAHCYACDCIGISRATTIGEEEGSPNNLPESDPQYKLYWEHFARYHTKILAAAISYNSR